MVSLTQTGRVTVPLKSHNFLICESEAKSSEACANCAPPHVPKGLSFQNFFDFKTATYGREMEHPSFLFVSHLIACGWNVELPLPAQQLRGWEPACLRQIRTQWHNFSSPLSTSSLRDQEPSPAHPCDRGLLSPGTHWMERRARRERVDRKTGISCKGSPAGGARRWHVVGLLQKANDLCIEERPFSVKKDLTIVIMRWEYIVLESYSLCICNRRWEVVESRV